MYQRLHFVELMNYFCGMVDQRKAFSLISTQDHCQRFSPSQISNMPQAEFEPVQKLNSGFKFWNFSPYGANDV